MNEKALAQPAPIDRLPHELLERIFEDAGCAHCAVTVQKACRKPDTHVVSMVCSRWRDIILNSPVFWSNIAAGSDVNGRLAIDERNLPDILERSGDSTLHVTLDMRVGPINDSVKKLIPLLQECPRWHSLGIHIPGRALGRHSNDKAFIAQALGLGSGDSRLSCLKSLTLGTIADTSIIRALQLAPNLETLIVIECVSEDNRSVLQLQDCWPMLREVAASPFALLPGEQRLGWMTSVESVSMRIDRYRHQPISQVSGRFYFPSVKDLSLCCISTSSSFEEILTNIPRHDLSNTVLPPDSFPSFINDILTRFQDTPLLESLSIAWLDVYAFRSDRSAPHLCIGPLLQFMYRNGHHLSRLSISNLLLEPAELQALLGATPTLTSLQIDEADMGVVVARPSKVAMVTEAFLMFLTASPKSPLPHLKHVNFTVNRFHDEAFTKMVLSRQKTNGHVAGLSAVALTLSGIGDLSETDFFKLVPSLVKSVRLRLRDLKGCALTRVYPPSIAL